MKESYKDKIKIYPISFTDIYEGKRLFKGCFFPDYLCHPWMRDHNPLEDTP